MTDLMAALRAGLAGDVPAAGTGAGAGTGWQVSAADGWAEVAHEEASLPDQGWKLHLSATAESAREVLARSLPVLTGEPTNFKVAYGLADRPADHDGRVITVYPTGDAQAVRLAVALDQVTAGLDGPRILSSQPLRPASVVHYRYGAFTPRWLQNSVGEVVPALVSPDGELEPDRRAQSYAAPSWATDPFLAARVVERRSAPELVVAGRYLTVRVLDTQPELTVALAIDAVTGEPRVLKRSRPRTREGPRDRARARLRHEAAVLARVSRVANCVPAVVDLLDDGDGLVLVLEHRGGESLEHRAGRKRADGTWVTPDEARGWVAGVARALGHFHTAGLVYNDLTPGCVVVGPDGAVSLAGASHAWPAVGTPHSPAASPAANLRGPPAATPGYASPQRVAGLPPAFTDDVYSLGAILWFLLTGADPTGAPNRSCLLDRPVALLKPGAPPALAEVARRCLAPDAPARPQSMAEVETMLHAIPDGRRPWAAMPRATGPAAERAAARHLDLARSLALHLCRKGLCRTGDPVEHEHDGFARRDVSGGAAGVLLALAQAAPVLDEPEIWSALVAGASWLASAGPLPGGPLPGLYVGEAGIAITLMRVGQTLDDGRLRASGLDRGRFVALLPHLSPDLYNGSAGRIRAHLAAWDASGDDRALAAAVAAGAHLLSVAERPLAWAIPAGYAAPGRRRYLGYAHGLAGVADCLLDLYEVTGDPALAEVVHEAVERLTALARPVTAAGPGLDWPGLDWPGLDWPGLDWPGLDWPDEAGGELVGPLWCHGAAGVARFLLHALTCGVAPDTGPTLAAALGSTAFGARNVGPGQCHGLAGLVEVLLDAYQALGEPTYLVQARELGELLEAFTAEPDGMVPPSPGAPHPTDLMTGVPGIMSCFIRLADPSIPHLLGRPGLSGRKGQESSSPSVVGLGARRGLGPRHGATESVDEEDGIL